MCVLALRINSSSDLPRTATTATTAIMYSRINASHCSAIHAIRVRRATCNTPTYVCVSVCVRVCVRARVCVRMCVCMNTLQGASHRWRVIRPANTRHLSQCATHRGQGTHGDGHAGSLPSIGKSALSLSLSPPHNPSLSLSLARALSLLHTHTRARARVRSLWLCPARVSPRGCVLRLSRSLSHTHTHTLSLSLSLALARSTHRGN